MRRFLTEIKDWDKALLIIMAFKEIFFLRKKNTDCVFAEW